MRESTWRRALEDTEQFRTSRMWFWGVEVLGSAGLASLTAGLTFNSLHGWQMILLTFFLFAFGLVIVYGAIYLWNLFRTPYRQRDEVHVEYAKLKQSIEEQKVCEAKFEIEVGVVNIEPTGIVTTDVALRPSKKMQLAKIVLECDGKVVNGSIQGNVSHQLLKPRWSQL
jgi:hypothetical protein